MIEDVALILSKQRCSNDDITNLLTVIPDNKRLTANELKFYLWGVIVGKRSERKKRYK